MESLRDILSRVAMRPNGSGDGSATSSDRPEPEVACALCNDARYVLLDVPFGHADFGKAVPCECAIREARSQRLDLLIERSQLGPLRRMTFETLAGAGPSTDPTMQKRFAEAMKIARHYAERPEGWLVFAGASGSGKTHLAAAIANQVLEAGTPVLFVVVADLLDHLRAAFSPTSDTEYDDLFDDVKNFPLLVLDDIGAQSPTSWAEEKLYQVLNHRSNAQLPTVITSSLPVNRLSDRVRTRLNDTTLATVIDLSDSREHVADALDVLSTALISRMTFESFEAQRYGLDPRQVQTLQAGYRAARNFAENPDGWLVFFGGVGVGKTHLAASIANYRVARGEPVRFVVVPDLLDHLRSAYAPDSKVTFDDLVHRIRTAPLLVLDDLGTQTATEWAREKLFQILNYRYNDRLPTVFTTSSSMEDLWRVSPAIASRMADTSLSTLIALDAPDYRSGEVTRPTVPSPPQTRPRPNRRAGP